MKNWLKRITGIANLEAIALDAKERRQLEEETIQVLKEETLTAEMEAARAREEEVLAKLTPKERATKQKEPWISVLDTKINPENIRNGFFELDWNQYFVTELIQNGYGTEADPEEEIVDRWFRDIVYNMFAEEGLDTSRNAGYINVVPISKGKSEVS